MLNATDASDPVCTLFLIVLHFHDDAWRERVQSGFEVTIVALGADECCFRRISSCSNVGSD